MCDSKLNDERTARDLLRKERDMRRFARADLDEAGPYGDESQDPRRREPGPAVEFRRPEVPDGPHLGPTIGLGPDDLPPYTHDERGDH